MPGKVTVCGLAFGPVEVRAPIRNRAPSRAFRISFQVTVPNRVWLGPVTITRLSARV